MSDLAYVAAFIAARLDEDEAAANAACDTPRLPWQDDEWSDQPEAWIAHYGRHDPARALRAIKAKRSVLAACTRAAEAGPDSPAGVLALAVLDAMSTEWEHPDRPFVPDWTIRPGVLLRESLEAQGKSPDRIPGARLFIEGTRRIDARHAMWIGELLGTSPEMWLNAQRLYDAALLRGAKDTSEEHEHD